MTVLVIGCDPGLLATYYEVFSHPGHTVLTATSRAVAETACRTVDAIVITSALSVEERNHLAEHVRARAPEAIIVCAERCEAGSRIRCLSGADVVVDFLEPQEVLAFVTMLHNRRRPFE